MPTGSHDVSPIGRFDGRAHVFVPDLDAPVLDDEDAHHLGRVLRIRPGEWVTVGDGRGGWRACRLRGELIVEGPVVREARPEPLLTVGFAPVKGDRPEWVVQKLTELGVDRIVPIEADRSVVRWDGDRVQRNLTRFRRIAREAAMQSRAVWLPEVGLPEVGSPAAGLPTARAMFAGGAAAAELTGAPLCSQDVVVLVGPEGGWSPEELAGAPRMVKASDKLLRTETAAVTVGALMGAIRSQIVT